VNGWDRVGEWLATLALASLAWVSGLAGGDPPDLTGPTGALQSSSTERQLMIGWAQTDAEPPIEQVGEETGDSESLDTGAAEPGDTATGDDEPLDAGSPAAADVEPLDQGPDATAVPATEPVPAAAPAPDYVATTAEPVAAAPAGPVIPPGFGTGRVHAVAGRSEIPAGLENCHVGAVTGRAYVGIDCGDDGAAFVGHAPSFQDFPFIAGDFPFGEGNSPFDDPNFPFDDDSPFAVSSGSGEGSGNVVVSAQRSGKFRDKGSRDSEITTTGDASVRLAQRAREREPRTRVGDPHSKRGKDSANGRNESSRADTNSSTETRAGAREGKSDTGKKVNLEQKSKKHAKDKKHKRAKRQDRAKQKLRDQSSTRR
jgi:hypothetical protein